MSARTARSFIKPHFLNIASSQQQMQGFTAEINLEPGRAENAGPYTAMQTHHILLRMCEPSQQTRLAWKANGRRRDQRFEQGQMILNPAGLLTEPQWNHNVRLEVLAIDLSHLLNPSQFDASAGVELVPNYGFRDPLLSNLLESITREQLAPHPDTLYCESMASAVAAHLLHRYATRPSVPVPRGGLSEPQLRLIEEYLRAHLSRSVRLDELAALVGLSSSHLVRLFRRSTGRPPHQHLMRLRLHRAAELLRHSQLTIAEIAAQTGFADQSHLTRLFTQQMGVTPRRFRAHR